MWRSPSIRRRVPLLICGLLFVVIAIYAVASYQAVRRSVVADTGARLTEAVAQLRGVLGSQLAQAQGRVRELAASAPVSAALRGGGADVGPSLRESLAADPSDDHLTSELLDASGRLVAAAPDTIRVRSEASDGELQRVLAGLADAATGPIRLVNGRPVYPVAARVEEAGRTLGYVVRWYGLSTSPQNRQLIEDMIGTDAHLYVGNTSGNLWTDLVDPVAPPTADAGQNGALEYARSGEGSFLAASATIPGTAWTVLVESPRELALAPARATLFWLVLVGLLVLALGTGLAWALSARLTGDLTTLAAAAQSISRGDYGRRVHLDRSDEIGALGGAFNTMSAAVAEAQAALERKVGQLANSEVKRRETRERLQHVTASSPAILYELRLYEHGNKLEWISDNVRERLGYTVREALEPGWWQGNLHPEDRELLMGSVASEGPEEDRTREYRFRHGNGEYRWILDEQRVVRDEEGRIGEIVGAMSDISDRRQLEEQFRMSQKLEAVGQLAGGVAHDFNNLLTVILGEVDEAQAESEAGTPQAGALANIEGAATRAAALTRQLLTFSRQSVVDTSVFDANAVVQELHSMLRRVIGEDVALELRLTEPLGAVVADRGQIDQVLMNLVVNARDATSAGGTITIETAEVFLDQEEAGSHGQLTSGEFVILSVSDTGTGMTEDVKGHLFEPFFTTKEHGKGTGLGLATCYAIVDRFGGHIMVYSEPGVGTTVKVYLPRASQPAESDAEAGSDRTVPRGHETILVVEDDEPVRAITTRILTGQGYRVIEAGDGEEAMSLIESDPEPLDLLLTDVVMPRMGGRALATRIREVRPDLPILFVSGYSDEFIIQNQLFDRGMALVQKPFTRDTLARKVREALDRRV